MDSAIKIKQAKLSERCEICHQSDCFNPKTEECSRCAKLNLKPINIDQAVKHYIFNKTFIWVAVTSIVVGLIFIYLAYAFEMFFEICALVSTFTLFIGLSSFLYYQYRCRRLIWLVKNIQPINVEFTLKQVSNASGFGSHYIELKLNKVSPITLPIYPPPWDISSVVNELHPALAYFDPKGGTILRLDKGLIMSLGTPDFSSFMNQLHK